LVVQLLKEQNKFDQMPSGLLDRVKRILPFANIVAEEIVCEETDILEKIIPRMFEVMHRVAKVSCDYVRHGRWSPNGICMHVLIIVARTAGGPAYQEKLEEMDRELTGVIEDFNRAVNVEALRRTKETGEDSLPQSPDSSFPTFSCRAGAFT
jgi:hypothetical protein